MEEIITLGESKQKILEELLEKPRVVYELSDSLNIRSNAIREHLIMLEGMGYVESKLIEERGYEYYKGDEVDAKIN